MIHVYYAAWRGTGRGVHGLIMVDHSPPPPPPPPLPHDRLRLYIGRIKAMNILGEGDDLHLLKLDIIMKKVVLN